MFSCVQEIRMYGFYLFHLCIFTKICHYLVGTDIEIKLKPSNDKEHITKESMSEENMICEPPLKTAAPCTQPVKVI